VTVLRSGSATDVGLVRTVNQDLAARAPNLYAVADGMGGHAGGEVAARVAVETLGQAFGRQPTGGRPAEAVTEANAAVWQRARTNADLRGMGTTLTAVALVGGADGHDVLALANVGDSRAYRVLRGEMVQVTDDHSLAEERMRQGEMTEAEAAVHPQRHILTRALGVSSEVDVDMWELQLRSGATGSSSAATASPTSWAPTRWPTSSHGRRSRRRGRAAGRAANEHGGSDNITVVVVDVQVGEDGDASVPAVAAVAADFRTASPEAEEAAGDQGEWAQASTPELPASSRRERRRAKRRERRAARGRRLITFRTLLFVILFGAVLAGAFYAVRWYDTNSYFVGVSNNELVIYQGRVGGFLWYHPQQVERTGVTTADVSAQYVSALQAGVEETSVASARTYVANLVCTRELQVNPAAICSSSATVTTTTTTTTTRPTTTSVPAPSTTKVT
jgi:serine/threonine protein phosphatase PrpC